MSELRRILYVEDDPDIQAIARLALEAVGGFAVELASSGEQALRRLDNQLPDLILLDVMMPGMDGTDTLRAIKARPRLCCIPIVFMTARVQAHEEAAYLKLGAIGVIAKPFDAMTLSSQIEKLWQAWLEKTVKPAQ